MTARPTVVRRDAILLCVFALALLLPGLGARDLWNPNEPTYGLAVAEMAEQGEWLIPTVNGERFLEKPILYFWLARVTTTLLGVNEFALRLPGALAAVLATLFVYLLGTRHAGRFTGLAAAWLFLTTQAIVQGARFIQMDILATAAVVATVYYGLAALEHPEDWRPWAATGLAAGLGFLGKGPVTWICAGIPLAAAGVFLRSPRFPSLRQALVAVGVVLATLAVWIVPLLVRGETDALHEALIRQNFTRFLEPWDHVQPWWYYLKYVWIELAPWSLLLPLVVWFRPTSRRTPMWPIGWSWLLGTVLFFSLSASKRAAYLMPAAPALALLVAIGAERLFVGTLGRSGRGVLLLVWSFAGIALLGAAWLVHGLHPRYPAFALELGLTALLLVVGGVGLLVAVGLPGRDRRAPVTFLVVLTALQLTVGGLLLPRANVFKSARAFARDTAQIAADDPVVGYRLWVWRADYIYYLGRRIGRLEDPQEARRRWEARERLCVIVEQWKRDEFVAAVGPIEPSAARDVGSKRVELYCNR